jgi:hypothetical protein
MHHAVNQKIHRPFTKRSIWAQRPDNPGPKTANQPKTGRISRQNLLVDLEIASNGQVALLLFFGAICRRLPFWRTFQSCCAAP